MVVQGDHPLADGDPRAAAPETATYGTWIRTSRLYIFAAISVIALAGASLTGVSAWFALRLVPAALFGYIAVVLVLTVWRLGPRGGDFQRRIHDLIVARAAVDPARRGLDIGCGAFDVVISCLTFHEVRDVTDKQIPGHRRGVAGAAPGWPVCAPRPVR